MYWVIRWTELRTGEDRAIVVEAASRVVAETIALKRDIPAVFIGPAEDNDVEIAREAKLLWGATKPAHTAFGCAVELRHVACLLLCGIWIIGVLLQSAGILPTATRLQF